MRECVHLSRDQGSAISTLTEVCQSQVILNRLPIDCIALESVWTTVLIPHNRLEGLRRTLGVIRHGDHAHQTPKPILRWLDQEDVDTRWVTQFNVRFFDGVR